MRKGNMLLSFTFFACLLFVAGITDKGWAQTPTEKKTSSTGLQQRIDFGNAYIMGQSIKSGAVYLLHRKQSDIKSMLQYRENYRQEILEDFLIQEDKSHKTQLVNRDSEGIQEPAISK
jgi:hypothetical protein